jgi:hypothetical protein
MLKFFDVFFSFFSRHHTVDGQADPRTQAPGLWGVVRSEEMKKTER